MLTSHRPKELPSNVTHVARIEGGRIVGREMGTFLISSTPRPVRVRTGRARSSMSPFLAAGSFASRNATIYRDYRPVIRDLNWTLLPGEHWAVLGANGSRQVDVAEPDLRRPASGARRHDRARRPVRRRSHRGVEASRRVGFAGAAGRSLRGAVARRSRHLRPLRQRRTERAADRSGSAQRAPLARILRHRGAARPWPAQRFLRPDATRAARARDGERSRAAAAG